MDAPPDRRGPRQRHVPATVLTPKGARDALDAALHATPRAARKSGRRGEGRSEVAAPGLRGPSSLGRIRRQLRERQRDSPDRQGRRRRAGRRDHRVPIGRPGSPAIGNPDAGSRSGGRQDARVVLAVNAETYYSARGAKPAPRPRTGARVARWTGRSSAGRTGIADVAPADRLGREPVPTSAGRPRSPASATVPDRLGRPGVRHHAVSSGD